MRTNLAHYVRSSLPALPLVVLMAVAASASAQQNGPAIITGLSPDAVGHFDADQCRGCSVENDGQGLCDNTCVTCHDAGRTFAGDGAAEGCGQFADAQSCNGGWQHNQIGTPVSCFFHPQSVCVICDDFSEKSGLCSNTCYPCADAARTTFAGGSQSPDGCRNFDGNQNNCGKAWVLNGFSEVPISCFYDGTTNECHACEVSERFGGQCTNTCVSCEDPQFTQLVDEPGGAPCETLAGNEGACSSTWHFAHSHLPAPCFFTAGTEKNQGGFIFIQDGFDRLGPLVTNGKKLAVCLGCNGTTALDGFNSGFDESTLPGLGWTRTTITVPAEIADFLVNQMMPGIDDAGLIYIPSQENDSSHQGIITNQVAVLNQFKTQLGAFVTSAGGGLFALNQASLEGGFGWLDAIVPGAQARPASTCFNDPTFTPPGMTTFPHVDHALLQTLDQHTYGYFLGTFDPLAILGTDQCRDVTCKEPSDTNFLGSTQRFFDDLCKDETSPATCDVSWHLAGGPAFSCAFDTQSNSCERCGPTFSGPENCANECRGCDDPSRTNFAGELNEPNCEGLSGPEACASSWAIGRDGLNVSCFFDVQSNFCRACETEDEINEECDNTCEPAATTHAVILGPDFSTASPTPTAIATAPPTSTVTATPSPTATTTPSPTFTAVPTPTATATAGPPGSLVPFQCYALDRDLAVPIPNVQTVDRLSSGTGELRRPTRLCAPADVDGADPGAPADPRHLLGYELRDRAPRFTKMKHVGVTDRFGTLDVDVIRPVLVMTPTRKSREADPGAPDAIGLDHFQCYHVVGAKEREDNLDVTDQFGSLTLDIKRPFRLCVATAKNKEPVADPSAALSCYRIRQEKPRFPGVAPIFVHDQFGPRQISVKRPTELCVPATVTLPD